MLGRIRAHEKDDVGSFVVELTLSARGLAKHVQGWRAAGFRCHLVFLSLASADLAVARVDAGSRLAATTWTRRRFGAGTGSGCKT